MTVAADNAVAEGVADRVDMKTADMRTLPFADHSFDVVLSSMAIHNIDSAAGRDQAVDEAWRVLRPRGCLLITDILKSRQYQARLRALGATVDRRALGWRMWWGGPWVSTMLVTARKPAGSSAVPSADSCVR